jgi:membrane protein DedA with SNARE-associated domain
MLESFARFVQNIVVELGYPGLFVLIALESTLVPIPSELVMPFAGFLAARGDFSLAAVLVINSVGAVVGSGACYAIGRFGGKPLLLRYGKWFLIRRHDIDKTEKFFAEHGKATILVARFVPVIRHIISLPAGLARMKLVPFFVQTFIGSTIWGSFLILLGYELGSRWDTVANKIKKFDLVIGLGIVVAVVGLAIHFYLRRRRRERGLAAENNAD